MHGNAIPPVMREFRSWSPESDGGEKIFAIFLRCMDIRLWFSILHLS